MEYTTNTTWKGNVKISQIPYESKPTDADYQRMEFNQMTVPNSLFSNIIQQGYSYCPTNRSKSKVAESDYIAIDIDGSYIPMDEFVESIKYKPTIYYTTPNNGNESEALRKYNDKDRKFRFRFIYSLTRPTNGVAQYDTAFEYITTENGLYEALPDKSVDKLEPNQLYNGSFGCEIHCTDRIYTLPDYIYNIEDNYEECECPSFVSEKTVKAFKKMRLREFLLWFVEHNGEPGVLTETPYIPSDIDGMLLPAGDFLCVQRKYGYYDQKRKRKVYYKWKDGENRHGKLFLAGLVIKRLNPHLGPDELFYGFVKVLYENYDIMNSDGTIKYTRERILNEFNSIMATDFNYKGDMVKHRSFEVDSLYCLKKGISKREAVCQINNYLRSEKKEENYQKIDSLLPLQMILSMSYKKCVSYLHDKGIEMSYYSFKNYLKDRGIKKIERKKK